MRRSSKPLPKDPNQRAAEIVRLSREEPKEANEQSPISQYLSQIGRKGGLKGGPARAKRLSKNKLREIGKKAAKARWDKHKKDSHLERPSV